MASLLRLALPVIVVQLGLMAMGTVDMLMVGRISGESLAAIALGHVYFMSAVIFMMGTLTSIDPFVSQALGAGDEAAVTRVIRRGLVLALALSFVSMLIMAPAAQVLEMLNQPAEVIPEASAYVHVSIPGAIAFLIFFALRQSLQAMHRMRAIVWTILAMNVANVLLNRILIFGGLGIPALGSVGTAWASTICRWGLALSLLAVIWPRLRQKDGSPRPFFRWAPFRQMLSIGLPIGIQISAEFGAFAVMAVLMGHFGATTMAGHQVAINLASLTFMVPLGISMAAAVRVGHAVGRRQPAAARQAALTACVFGVSFMSLCACIFIFRPHELARAYSPDPEVIAMAAVFIPIAGVFQIVDGLQIVASGALRGAADTRMPMLMHGFAFWLVGIPLGWYLAFETDVGPRGLWWGCAIGLAIVALLLSLRLRRILRHAVAPLRLDT